MVWKRDEEPLIFSLLSLFHLPFVPYSLLASWLSSIGFLSGWSVGPSNGRRWIDEVVHAACFNLACTLGGRGPLDTQILKVPQYMYLMYGAGFILRCGSVTIL